MIEFDYNLITHVEEMDKQHMRLVALLNHTYELLKEGKKRGSHWAFQKRNSVLRGVSSVRRGKVYGKNRLS
ncbi:MAG: hypothetical protein GU346_05365 [Thermocrinis sp.]|jgi:hemerythrin|nr:hypothetical protein [Thermocrinis sp.]